MASTCCLPLQVRLSRWGTDALPAVHPLRADGIVRRDCRRRAPHELGAPRALRRPGAGGRRDGESSARTKPPTSNWRQASTTPSGRTHQADRSSTITPLRPPRHARAEPSRRGARSWNRATSIPCSPPANGGWMRASPSRCGHARMGPLARPDRQRLAAPAFRALRRAQVGAARLAAQPRDHRSRHVHGRLRRSATERGRTEHPATPSCRWGSARSHRLRRRCAWSAW